MISTEDLKKGYNTEEEYFFKQNQELIQKRRRELDEKKQGQVINHDHWMKCPKCGCDMQEIELSGINVDKCASCQGIYFDHGELQTVLESKEQKGFLGAIKRIFQ